MNLEISSDRSKLLKPCIPWSFVNPPMDIVDIAESMVNLMLEKNGFGLAYNQTTLPGNFSMFAMKGEPENFFFINPEIVDAEGEQVLDWEGCISYKGFVIKQERFHQVRLRFSGPNGERFTKLFKGLSARVIQHEMDHLDGLPWWWNISKLRFDKFKKMSYKKGWRKEYERLTYKGLE